MRMISIIGEEIYNLTIYNLQWIYNGINLKI